MSRTIVRISKSKKFLIFFTAMLLIIDVFLAAFPDDYPSFSRVILGSSPKWFVLIVIFGTISANFFLPVKNNQKGRSIISNLMICLGSYLLLAILGQFIDDIPESFASNVGFIFEKKPTNGDIYDFTIFTKFLWYLLGVAIGLKYWPQFVTSNVHLGAIKAESEEPIPSSNQFFLWQGFEHDWRYNHRVNRMGSYIDQFNKVVTHTGASGTGEDELSFRDYFAQINAPNLKAHNAKIHFELQLENKNQKHLSRCHKVIVENVEYPDNVVVLINGFDLISKRDSDKLHLLDIEIEKVRKEEGNTVSFCVYIQLNTDCKTVECELGSIAAYDLDVHYLLLSGPPDDFSFAPSRIYSNDYVWDRGTELNLDKTGFKRVKTYSHNSVADYPHFSLGYKRIYLKIAKPIKAFQPDRTIHLKEVNLNITEVDIIGTNLYRFKNTMAFKNWAKHMRDIFVPHSWFSLKQAGSFYCQTEFMFLHIKDASIKNSQSISDSIYWPGSNKPSTDPEAVKTYNLKTKNA